MSRYLPPPSLLLVGLRTKIRLPLNAELNPICHLLPFFTAHPILHVSMIWVKQNGLNGTNPVLSFTERRKQKQRWRHSFSSTILVQVKT
jgi:hypothetical protein